MRPDGLRLADKRVIITGASSGIGEATAGRSVREGARVMLVARGAERLQRVAVQLGAAAI